MTVNRLLYTRGQGYFQEDHQWPYPVITNNKNIIVKSVLTGICRSDVDMMQGKFGPLPMSMQGHEGLAQVLEIGNEVADVKVGDWVATRGEPAFADFYECRHKEYVKVPECDPRYILEPVACAVNIFMQCEKNIISKIERSPHQNIKIALLGTGFLAQILDQIVPWQMDVYGSNRSNFGNRLVKSIDQIDSKYDVLIDLSKHNTVFDQDILNPGAIVVMAVEKSVTTNFSKLLWNAVTMVFPSPRNDSFYDSMVASLQMIENGQIKVDNLWQKGYNRDNWQEAFSTASEPGKRIYLDWRNS